MFVPLHDENTLKSIRFQFVTIALIAINVAVYLFEVTGLDEAAVASLGVVPKDFFDAGLLPAEAPGAATSLVVSEPLKLFSYMFLHGDIFHLAGNMLFLWVFGDNVEDALGHLKFLVFYLACGVFAALFYAWLVQGRPESTGVLIGASGAVAGVIAAYLMLHPRVRVWVLALKAIPLRISAAFVLGLWVLWQIVMVSLPQQFGQVAWGAHIGGLLAGAVLVVFMRRSGVPLFDKRISV
jgi:membrane associated rhomboid family serine protease